MEDCQIGEYLDDGNCLDCPEQCTECNSPTVCLACNQEFTLTNSECIKKEETTISTVAITDCVKYEDGACIHCKYGTPFVDYEYLSKNLSGLCKCPQDNYKIKITENELVKYECQVLNISIVFDLDVMISETLNSLAQNAQISYALQKSSQNLTQKDENEIILLKTLVFKIAQLESIGSENLELILDVLEIINCSSTEKENYIIDHLKMILDLSNFTTNEEYQDLLSFMTELQQKMSSESQNIMENEVLLAFQQKFLQLKKTDLATGIVSLALSTGQIELSKIQDEKTFNNVKLTYPSTVLEALKENNQSISLDNIDIIVSVQQTSKDQFKKDGIDAKLLLDPITVLNQFLLSFSNQIINYQMKNDDNQFSACPKYSGDAAIQICFDGMSQLQNAVCMYWDESISRWSTEGVSLNAEKNCCESTHFSTFGVIENGEQIFEVNAANPGEYGDNQLCDALTVNCLECNPETGACLKCVGYLNPMDDGSCCGTGTKRVYSNGIWSCTDENYESPTVYVPDENCSNVIMNDMMLIAYESKLSEKLGLVITQINLCPNLFNTSGSILTELQILNGIMKDSSNIDEQTMIDAINISSTIFGNEQANSIEIIKQFFEFQGQIIKKIHNNQEKYQEITISSLFDNVIQCFKKLLQMNTPTNSTPSVYHLSNFYLRIGKIIPEQTLTSFLYQQKYGIQFGQELLTSLNDGNSYYYIHAVEQIVPYWNIQQTGEKSYAQYFRIYDKDFNGIEQIGFKHCNDLAPIKFQSPGSDAIIVLKQWENNAWKTKVVCYDANDIYAICYPASYSSQFLFIIDEIQDIPLQPQESCLIEDIPGCRVCNSEKECKTCYDGLVLQGENYKYYGRCECPEGYYKTGFNSTDCAVAENLQETWNQTVSQFPAISTLKNSFIDLALTVVALNNNTAYEDYMTKLISMMNNQISMEQLNLVLDVVNLFSSSIRENIEGNYYKIFQIIYNITANKTIGINNATFIHIIETGDKVLFKLQNREYKTNFYNLLFQNILNTMFIHNIKPTFELENGHLGYQSLQSQDNITIGTTTLEVTSVLWNRLKEATCDTYEIVMHEMNKNQNPYDLIQIATMYSSIVNFELLCITGSTVTVYDKLSLSAYYTISFQSLGSGITSPQCVYWNQNNNSWDIDGSRKSSYTNKCEWKHFSTFAIIQENSSSTICDSRCKTCKNYSICITCESDRYLINDMCYSSNQLTLDLVLKENAIVYIRKVTENTYIGYDADNQLSYFELSNATPILYSQIQWRVNIVTSSNTYTFTNVYLNNENSKLNYTSTQNFKIQKLDNLNDNLSSLYQNEGLMIPFSQIDCLTTDASKNFILETCNQNTKSQWWEFIPKKSTDHDPIPLSTELSGTDTIQIKYNHNNNQDISQAVFILALVYPTNLDTLDSLTCSSSNKNSSVTFQMKEKNVQVEVSLSDLLTCGFKMETDTNNNTVISGEIIVIFSDTEQIFYYPFAISLDSNASIIEADILKEASITSIQVQQGSASALNTQFVATVKLLNSASSQTTGSLEINGDFTLQLSLPSDVQSTYSIADPGTGSLIYAGGSYSVILEIQNSTKKNTYEVQVTVPNTIPDGSYRLKFSCVLTLQSNLLRRILSRFLTASQAGLIVDKSFTVVRTNNSNNVTQPEDTENQTIFDNTAVQQEESVDNSLNLGIILLLAMSGIVALSLIVGIIYYAIRIQKNKKMRDSIIAKKQIPTPENVEVDNLAECPNKI